ncbi:TIGR03032 family protein [Xenococcus sp. PCC 7305]|uniref:TIGR03032 family protein n=1 Tax=Xenococcus sp. PCC 7305 TaxID=102125 RepID=UPI0002ABD5AE|nr:TIGR03032 family protein [Xenococcus sp. PCC 7305]ELS03747.1 TIGR03032 family protein [Xenococcus sp. PCC 7305]
MLEIFSSRQFPDWLGQQNISLALTTYQTGQLIFLGVNPAGQLSGFQRLYDRAMGLYTTPERLYLSCKSQLWQLDNALESGQLHQGYDKLYIPRVGNTTGDLDIHDLAIDRDGKIIFVSSLLNCLATTSDRKSCKPLWKPDFISRIINEDRCHLNGMAMVDGQPGYVTACSRSDLVDGWRDRRVGGGIVIDIASNEIICTDLTMPHSPRWYQDKLWLHNSGRGELGYVDFATGKFEAVAFCPGYLRGLAFWGNYAIVGLSKPRNGDRTFSGLPLDELLQAKDGEARCGLMVVDLNTGAIANWVRFEGAITELYDVQIIANAKRPMALGFQTDEIAQLISLESPEAVNNNYPNQSSLKNDDEKVKQQQRHELNLSLLPQSANQESVTTIDNKMKFLFLVGVEGTGHHMIRAILANCFEQDHFVPQGEWHQLLLNYWDASQRFKIENETPDCSKSKNIREELAHIFQSYSNQNATHLFESLSSFPCYQPRQTLRRPDIIDFADIVSDLIEVKYLILYRNPVSATYSAIRRGFTDNIYLQAKIVESNLIYIDKQFSQLPQTSYKVLHFEEFLDNPTLYSKKIADWWNLDRETVVQGLANFRQPFPYSQIPTKEKEILENFFTQKRINQWQNFYTSNQIYSVAQNNKQSLATAKKQNLVGSLATQQRQNTQAATQSVSTQQHDTAEELLKRSRTLKKIGSLEEAEVCLRKAITLKPDFWGAYNNLGTLLQNQGQIAEAKLCYQNAIAHNNNFAQAISNLASIDQLEENLEKAKNGFYRALQIKPDYVPAHFNLANIFKEQKRLGGAIEHFEKVIALQPDHTEAYISLGNIFEYQDKQEKALACYQKALELNPDFTHLNFNIAMVKLRSCNWHNYERNLEQLLQTLENYLEQDSFPGVNIFALSAIPVPLHIHQAAAKSQAKTIAKTSNLLPQKINFQHHHNQPQKLRIGFISPDFREHAVGRLIQNIFPHFDRDRYEIYAYSTVDVNDHITQAVRSGCDVFVELAPLSAIAAAQRIHSDGIHIMIDLAGYTIGHGAAILDLQPAPVQAQWLGYPDTMGAEFMQYYLGDRTLITDEIAEHYTEEIIYLPHTFVASPLKISERVMTREEFGLPDDAFVFCSFNAHYKINPELFDAWLRILEQVPQSVLWLASGSGRDNLRAEAKKRGLAADRLIFAEKIPHEEYLARYALADLYLDTLIYNAGSTAAAVLWSGLPMLTCPGNTNASRMGASICLAGGLETAICNSLEEYEQKAVYLATHPQELAQIRQNLQATLTDETSYPPLFRVTDFVRSLEAACEQMWENIKH